MNDSISLKFLGAAETVTGSKYLVSIMGQNILVDCGMFQGLKKLRRLNWEKFPADPRSIDVVLLTHGHLDHVGHLPRLVKEGFTGQIWGTSPTLEIARIILEDSAKVQEEEAERARRLGYSKHRNPLPLYNLEDVKKTIHHFVHQPLQKWIKISDGVHARFHYNGHIIGATNIELKAGTRIIVFSGDIGRLNDPLLFPPERPERADVLVIESTYGNRLHPDNTEARLAETIRRSLQRNGTVIIPSFAVERTQLLMYLLWKLKNTQEIPKHVPVYMDSPMGTNVLDIFHRFTEWHRLSRDECDEMCRDIVRTQDIQETFRLASNKHPKIIIAGSGMATGGRVLTYFEHYLGDESATILLAGYQAEGTRGRQLLEGAPEIKLYGRTYSAKANIENIDGLSGHADQGELLNWLSDLKQPPKHIFITHGETEAADALKHKIEQQYGWRCTIPRLHEVIQIENLFQPEPGNTSDDRRIK